MEPLVMLAKVVLVDDIGLVKFQEAAGICMLNGWNDVEDVVDVFDVVDDVIGVLVVEASAWRDGNEKRNVVIGVVFVLVEPVECVEAVGRG